MREYVSYFPVFVCMSPIVIKVNSFQLHFVFPLKENNLYTFAYAFAVSFVVGFYLLELYCITLRLLQTSADISR